MNQQMPKEITTPVEVLHDGLAFGEGPRYRDGALYFSDMHAHQVLRYTPGASQNTGKAEVILELDDEPSGLGWLPNGNLLVVAMSGKSVLRWDGQQLDVWADLSELAPGQCNDMVVTPKGAAYVGNFGYDMHAGEKLRPTHLIYISPEGAARLCADDLMFPNGTVITPDGNTLIVAETFGGRLTSYNIGNDGSLSDRELWADLPEGAVPDGICLDDAGGVWVASPTTNDCLRIEQGGNVSHRVALDRGAFACMLGGTDLYILAARSSTPGKCKQELAGQLLRVPAPYAGAGYP